MAVRPRNRSFAIVGVVGRTFGTTPTRRQPDLVRVASSVGAAITQAGHAILTGGHHLRAETSVKYSVFDGARSMARETSPARLIGILPKSISLALEPHWKEPHISVHSVPDDPVRQLYVHTMLPSEKRDAITGQTADVFLALEGQSGTSREVAAALDAGRPVVSLNSLHVLASNVRRQLQKVAFPAPATPESCIPCDPHRSWFACGRPREGIGCKNVAPSRRA
jgi:predicted Rossmann-fold nucleotide-binding protein